MVPDTMPAAVYVGDGKLEVRTLPVPAIGADQALIEVSHCGICGSDLHLVLEQFARPGSVLGHEWAGTVAAVGDAVEGWAVGTPVVADDQHGCGQCRACRRGRPSVCLRRAAPDFLGSHGAYCQFVTTAAPRLLRIPDGLSVRTAALTEPTAIALHAVHLAGVTPEDRVLVTGAGPVGLLILAVLRSAGVTDVTVSEPAAARQRRAQAVGAADVVTPADLAPVPMGRTAEHPYTVAFECSGRAAAAAAALDQLDYAGTLVFVGTGHGVAPREPEPHDRARAHRDRRLQLRRRGVRAGAGPARLGAAARRPAPRTDRRRAERPAPDDATPRAGRTRSEGPRPSGGVPVTNPMSRPVLNHVALSVDPAILDEAGRAEVLDFYGDVFGWTEGDNSGERGNPLILYTGVFAQFIYLLPADPFVVAPPLDHFGLQVDTRAELEAIVVRAKARQACDDRVRIIDIESRQTPGPTHDYTLTSAYVGFLLPLMVELQHLEARERRPS